MKNLYVVALACLGLVACGPAKIEQWAEIEPDESAFVLPVEGDSMGGQQQFDSIDFLQENKVSAKRIILPLRKVSTGRMWFNFKWVPTVRVIKVSRAPISREWTPDEDGTNSKNEGIHVESLDSVGITVGVSITAHIPEDQSARFRYYYPENNLAAVIDTNGRSLATQYLSGEFGSLPLDGQPIIDNEGNETGMFGTSCKTEKKKISKDCRIHLQEFFSDKGIVIDSFGLVGGLKFDDPEIQTSITAQVKAAQDLKVAEGERRAQAERNLTDKEIADKKAYVTEKNAEGIANAVVKKAEGEAEAADILFLAKNSVLLKLEIFEREKRAEAMLAAGGNLPKAILPAGSPLLMGLDTK